MSQENIIRYWHAVELLQPQQVPKPRKRDTLYAPYFHDTTINRLIPPWSSDSPVAKQALPNKREWSHTAYAHVYDSQVVAKELEKLFGADQGYREPQSRESALFAVKFTAEGLMVPDSLVISSEAWFLGRARTGKDWTHGFDEAQTAIRKQIGSLMGGQVGGDALRELVLVIQSFLEVDDFFGDPGERLLRFRSTPINPKKPVQEDDPLNSFLLSDLSMVAHRLNQGITSAPLDRYLQIHDAGRRLHLDSREASEPLIERLLPHRYSPGCWPSERHLGLVHSQQLAVNTILETLADGEGLLGINGPPGTGKTTLLRDLVAAVVTRRADVLAGLRRASDAFVPNGLENANDGGRSQRSHHLKPELFGFEIVVASSNNGAVENVTLELPQRDKIDESWWPDADYFSDLGERVSGKPAWGLISGALGSKARRNAFVNRYFYGERPPGPLSASGQPDKPEVSNEDSGELLDEAESTIEDDAEREVDADAGPATDDEPQGLSGWLDAQADVERTTEERRQLWQQAVSDYKKARADVERIASSTDRLRTLFPQLCQARQDASRQAAALDELQAKEAEAIDQAARFDRDEWKPAHTELVACVEALERHQHAKPAFWQQLRTFGRAGRAWRTGLRTLMRRHALAEAAFQRADRVAHQREDERKQLAQSITDGKQRLERHEERARPLSDSIAAIAKDANAAHLLTWLSSGVVGRGDAIELAEPWIIDGWRQARANLFIQALKLHRTFLALEAKRLRTNLKFINSVLTGGRYLGVSRTAIRSAWASLFLVVPVLSSTFASFARSFGSLESGEIGWLLVDEAGQATPQAPVGALWRARRAVLVGDPLQLKPIVKVLDAVLEHMRTRYSVASHWLPNRQSAQTLADQATRWGRMMGPPDRKTWVGLPLLVHRRCDRPMYLLANRIAYDGVMVYGTLAPPPAKETRASLPTGWIHVRGPASGNWVPAEGEMLRQLIARLRADKVDLADISVITPFKDVKQGLSELLPSRVAHGTIHTMQGKESSIVVVVLGGNTTSSLAREWAVSEPNLLNVAATRAKRRLYMIGDRDDWKSRSQFCDCLDLLPPVSLDSVPTSPLPT
ncbi:DNA helicase [Burkholderia ubonensis]|uniref:DEAD/DEAH box helicase n=1 Tax=Burkholderia ubonensis TaxID=101571 RepID=UPI00075820B5|nr:AAA domain-containing protein [Burkholderia ubonensis]KVN90228.1 DNA helicase [Burkholderia ubonensis]